MAGVLWAAGLLAAQDPEPTPDPAARLQALQQEVREASIRFRQEMQEAAKAAKAEGRVMRSIALAPDMTPFVAKFRAAADDYAGTDDAVPFLAWIVRSGRDRDAATTALRTLAQLHAGSPALAELAAMSSALPRVVGEDVAAEFLAAVREANADPDVVGWLALGDRQGTIEKASLDSAEYLEAKRVLLARADAATDSRLEKQIHNRIDLREKLGVGVIAPDIEGVDLDGVAFRLSDYKGKVVFLDFWGDW